MTELESNRAWFAEKRYGYGAGLPIAWQGWAVLGAYVAMTPLLVWAIAAGSVATKAVAILLFALATGLFVEATRRHTRGGAWRWRWGKDD